MEPVIVNPYPFVRKNMPVENFPALPTVSQLASTTLKAMAKKPLLNPDGSPTGPTKLKSPSERKQTTGTSKAVNIVADLGFIHPERVKNVMLNSL